MRDLRDRDSEGRRFLRSRPRASGRMSADRSNEQQGVRSFRTDQSNDVVPGILEIRSESGIP